MKKIEIVANPISTKKKSSLLDKIKNNDMTTKLTMNIPIDLHQQLKIAAAKQRVNMGDIVISLVNTYIQKNA
jgi:hypothetical protein